MYSKVINLKLLKKIKKIKKLLSLIQLKIRPIWLINHKQTKRLRKILLLTLVKNKLMSNKFKRPKLSKRNQL